MASNKYNGRRGQIPKPAVCKSKRRRRLRGPYEPPASIFVGWDYRDFAGLEGGPVTSNTEVFADNNDATLFAGSTVVAGYRTSFHLVYDETDNSWSGYVALYYEADSPRLVDTMRLDGRGANTRYDWDLIIDETEDPANSPLVMRYGFDYPHILQTAAHYDSQSHSRHY